MNIPIVFATDSNFLLGTSVAICSLLENANQSTFYDIYVMLTLKTKVEAEKFFSKIEKNFSNYSLQYCVIDDALFQNSMIDKPYLTLTTYYRLYIAELLTDLDKCIYLDGDILVLQDLGDMYLYDIEEYYIAGVKDAGIQLADIDGEHKKLLEIESIKDYINAGILLMNLKRLREDKMIEMFLARTECRNRFEDQDVINACCYGKIYHLPVKYNLLNRYVGASKFLSTEVYSETEIIDVENPVIIHFPGWLGKPWNNLRLKYADRWWKFASKILEDEFECKLEEAQTYIRKTDWEYMLNVCRKHSKVVIWGFTSISKDIADYLLAAELDIDIVFGDNDLKKQGMRYKDISVCSMNTIQKEYGDAFYIVTSQKRYKEICNQLIEYAIPVSNISVYFYKNWIYYMDLDERYYEHELHQIHMREYGLMDYDRKNLNKDNMASKYWFDRWCCKNEE